ncbi:sorting nexin-15 isoform X1 [Desmodus rotundus]|uniref:sorting nexin-15 isoform X1 n=1 Tax=Desmodus rotundus TaxID=9430 RepID=UPI0023813BB9|nr:sorting nexin-15 isoform X1 [Desmodus rotundus]XP_045039264.2 sorting nexin-15 isoform X1 [Desmodus rotundus]
MKTSRCMKDKLLQVTLQPLKPGHLGTSGQWPFERSWEFISKRDPEDVKEVVVWKRYSDFRKLHGDLAYTHRNLFRRLEAFPAFPRAQVFGRFEASVIEERRKGAEDLLRFTVHIPALNNSPQLKEFFRGGEVTRPAQVSRDLHILPPPLIPTPPPEEPQPPPDESWLPQPLPAEKRGLEELEVPAEPLPSSPAQDALDLLFSCGSTEEASGSPARGPLTEAELALFDPFSKEEGAGPSPPHMGELAVMEAESERLDQEPWEPGGQEEKEAEEGGPTPAYLSQATELITQALRDEKAGAYPEALQGYRDGVHILLQGVPGDPSPARREGVKKKAAEYLKRAEEILHLHLSQGPP